MDEQTSDGKTFDRLKLSYLTTPELVSFLLSGSILFDDDVC